MLLLLLSLMFLFFYFFLYFFLCSVCMYVVCRKRKGYIFYFMTWRISISIRNDGVDIIRSGTWDYSATRMPKEWEDYDCWRSMNCGCCLIRTMWINLISWVPWKWKVIDTDHRHGMGMDCASVWCVWEIERERARHVLVAIKKMRKVSISFLIPHSIWTYLLIENANSANRDIIRHSSLLDHMDEFPFRNSRIIVSCIRANEI